MKPEEIIELLIKQQQALIPAILEVLKLHGLPTDCFHEPVKWIGTEAQQRSLHNLHAVLDRIMPPLPGDIKYEMPAFVYNADGGKPNENV